MTKIPAVAVVASVTLEEEDLDISEETTVSLIGN